MNSFLKLQYYSVLEYFRDKQAIFWTLVFPLIFLVVFRLFDTSGGLNANIIVIDNAKNEHSTQILDMLKSIEGVKVNEDYTALEDAQEALRESQDIKFEALVEGESAESTNRPNLILQFPENFVLDNTQNLEIFFNEAEEGQTSPSSIVESIITSYRNELNIQMTGVENAFNVERKGVAINDIGYYEFFFPGILGMGIMQSGIIGIASTIALLKEKGIMKRLSATPLASWKFILAEINTFLLISVLQITIMLLVAVYLLGANIYGSIPLIYFLGIGGSFVFLNLGFIAAALSDSLNAASSISNVLTLPMMFLSGVFFPRDTLPEGIKLVADLLPLSPLLDALRDVALQSKGIGDIQNELMAIFIWTLVTFLIAAKIFKFRDE